MCRVKTPKSLQPKFNFPIVKFIYNLVFQCNFHSICLLWGEIRIIGMADALYVYCLLYVIRGEESARIKTTPWCTWSHYFVTSYLVKSYLLFILVPRPRRQCTWMFVKFAALLKLRNDEIYLFIFKKVRLDSLSWIEKTICSLEKYIAEENCQPWHEDANRKVESPKDVV